MPDAAAEWCGWRRRAKIVATDAEADVAVAVAVHC